MEERRAAARVAIKQDIEATIGEVSVRIEELSSVGARLEHEQRFPLSGAELRIVWEGVAVWLQFKVVRSEIIGRRGTQLIYRTGIQFTGDLLLAQSVISSILRAAEFSVAQQEAPAPAPAPKTSPETPAEAPQPTMIAPDVFDDTWTRKVKFLDHDEEDSLPYAQFRRTDNGWVKSYSSSTEQPEDGFTIGRNRLDFAELQHTFECADPDTRRMMRIALQTELEKEPAPQAAGK